VDADLTLVPFLEVVQPKELHVRGDQGDAAIDKVMDLRDHIDFQARVDLEGILLATNRRPEHPAPQPDEWYDDVNTGDRLQRVRHPFPPVEQGLHADGDWQ